jgi:hypothetical protein
MSPPWMIRDYHVNLLGRCLELPGLNNPGPLALLARLPFPTPTGVLVDLSPVGPASSKSLENPRFAAQDADLHGKSGDS